MTRRFLVAALAMFSALPALPQRGKGPGGGPGNHLDFLVGYLGLSDSQKEQAQAIFDAADQATETVRGQMTSARDELNAAIKANSGDTELDRLAAAVGAIHGQLTAIRAKASAKFYTLLTDEQKQKYDDLMSRGPGRGFGPEGGGFGPR
jgi:Spy/CpxP family protein refolding chaperone